MSAHRQSQVLELLAGSGQWMTSAELADTIGVSDRSIRSYIAAIKDRAGPLTVVETGPDGYRIIREGYAEFVRTVDAAEQGTPRERVHRVIHRLVDRENGIDVYNTAAELFVSDSTLEADLTRIRAMLADTALGLRRSGSRVRLRGPELERRRLLTRLFREETRTGMAELESIQKAFESANLGSFKTDLIDALQTRGYYVNDYGMDNVLLHIAIAADRAGKSSSVSGPTRPPAGGAELARLLSELAATHFPRGLDHGDVGYLAYLLATRAVAPRSDAEAPVSASDYFTRDEYETVQSITTRASEEYLIDLSDPDFLTRLTVHVSNLLERTETQSFSRNPLTKSIKTTYPMIYELAVFITSGLHDAYGVAVNDDEIAYIAMHVGAHLQEQTRHDARATCIIVCPGYYDLQARLADRVTQDLGDALVVTQVITRSDVPWSRLDADLVLSTLAPPAPSEHIVQIQPFLTRDDVDRVRQSLSRVRRLQRRAALRDELLVYLDERLFVRNAGCHDEESMIRLLGERMLQIGVIDEEYVQGAIDRERMSSTAFTDTLAVPHAMEMTARRTSIAIAVNEQSMPWGDGRVNVVALIAFSAEGRAQFQETFDQFVEVFSERDDVTRIIRGAHSFGDFLDVLVRTMEG